MDGIIGKNSLSQQIYVLTPYVFHFCLDITGLQRFCLSIVFMLWLAFFGNQHIKPQKKTNFNDYFLQNQ